MANKKFNIGFISSLDVAATENENDRSLPNPVYT